MIGSLYCLCSLWLARVIILWFWFYDTQLKLALLIILTSTSKFVNFAISSLCWLPVTRPSLASWHVRVLFIKPCLHTQLQKHNRSYWKVKTILRVIFPRVGAFDHLKCTYDGAFEQLFGPGEYPGERCWSFDLTRTLSDIPRLVKDDTSHLEVGSLLSASGTWTGERIALMCCDISLTKITTKPRFENAKCKFYHEPIPKAVKMKRIPTWKQHEGNESLRKCHTNEAWWWTLSMWRNRAKDLFPSSSFHQQKIVSGARLGTFLVK